MKYSKTPIIHTSIIRSFWDQNFVPPTYMKYSKTPIIHTSIIRSFWDQNLVRLSTADNRGLYILFDLNENCSAPMLAENIY